MLDRSMRSITIKRQKVVQNGIDMSGLCVCECAGNYCQLFPLLAYGIFTLEGLPQNKTTIALPGEASIPEALTAAACGAPG